MLFRILLGINVITAAVMGYFFVIGLNDGSVSSFNTRLWLVTLLGIAAILGTGAWFRAKGRHSAANVVLMILAVPAFLFAAFMLAIIILQPRWN